MIETSSKHHYDSDGCDMVLLYIPQIIAHYIPIISLLYPIAYIAHVLWWLLARRLQP